MRTLSGSKVGLAFQGFSWGPVCSRMEESIRRMMSCLRKYVVQIRAVLSLAAGEGMVADSPLAAFRWELPRRRECEHCPTRRHEWHVMAALEGHGQGFGALAHCRYLPPLDCLVLSSNGRIHQAARPRP